MVYHRNQSSHKFLCGKFLFFDDEGVDILIYQDHATSSMTKHGCRGRKYRPYLKGKVNIVNVLATLAMKNVIATMETGVLNEAAWLSSVKAIWSMAGYTPVFSNDPIYVEIFHSDYSGVKVEEWIENTSSWTCSNKIVQKINWRQIYQVGIFDSNTDLTAGIDYLNDGEPIITKCNWALQTGQMIKVWVYNNSIGAMTDGCAITIFGHANLWFSGWVTTVIAV